MGRLELSNKIPRVQRVVLPIIRDACPSVKVGSWVEDIDFRTLPLINVRRIGGNRHRTRFNDLDMPVIELTAFHDGGLVECEKLYDSALHALYEAQLNQTVVPGAGYIHSVFERMGMTQFQSTITDSWRVQGLIKLGIRPPRN